MVASSAQSSVCVFACVQCKALESVVSTMEKLESELAIRSSNVQNFKVDVTDPSVLTRLKGVRVCVSAVHGYMYSPWSSSPVNSTTLSLATHYWQPLFPLSADKSEGGRFAQEIRHIAHKLDDYCDTLLLDVQKRVDLASMLIDCRLANNRKVPASRQLLKVRSLCVCVCVHARVCACVPVCVCTCVCMCYSV